MKKESIFLVIYLHCAEITEIIECDILYDKVSL